MTVAPRRLCSVNNLEGMDIRTSRPQATSKPFPPLPISDTHATTPPHPPDLTTPHGGLKNSLTPHSAAAAKRSTLPSARNQR